MHHKGSKEIHLQPILVKPNEGLYFSFAEREKRERGKEIAGKVSERYLTIAIYIYGSEILLHCLLSPWKSNKYKILNVRIKLQ